MDYKNYLIIFLIIVIIVIIYINYYNEPFRLQTGNQQFVITNYSEPNIKPYQDTNDIQDLSYSQYVEKLPNNSSSNPLYPAFQPNYILQQPSILYKNLTSNSITSKIQTLEHQYQNLSTNQLKKDFTNLENTFSNVANYDLSTIKLNDSLPASIIDINKLPSDFLNTTKKINEGFINDPNMGFTISQNDNNNVININGKNLENIKYVQTINDKNYSQYIQPLPFDKEKL